MKTIDFCRNKLESAGWKVNEISYERPKSGFKCIEGGYHCYLEVDEDDYDTLEKIPFDKNIFGTINGCGIINALYKDDFIKLVNKIPNKNNNKEVCDHDNVIVPTAADFYCPKCQKVVSWLEKER